MSISASDALLFSKSPCKSSKKKNRKCVETAATLNGARSTFEGEKKCVFAEIAFANLKFCDMLFDLNLRELSVVNVFSL